MAYASMEIKFRIYLNPTNLLDALHVPSWIKNVKCVVKGYECATSHTAEELLVVPLASTLASTRDRLLIARSDFLRCLCGLENALRQSLEDKNSETLKIHNYPNIA